MIDPQNDNEEDKIECFLEDLLLIQKMWKASIKENNEKKIKNCDEISKLIKVFPKDIAALDKRSVLAKVSSQGSGRQKPSGGQVLKVGEDNE